jgi:hypothetical protein
MAGGGAIVGAHQALRLAGSDALWVEGLEYAGESPFAPAFLRLEGEFGAGLPAYDFALYDGAAQWRATGAAQVLARLGEPLFQRGPTHYTSHAQSPFHHLTDYTAAARVGNLAAAAFPIGGSYYRHGYWIYREIFRRMVDSVLPERLIDTSAPLSAEVTLTHQIAEGARPARWMAHIVNFSPNRRSPEHCEFLEEPIPLHDVRLALRLAAPIARAYLAADGATLPLTQRDGAWELSVPRVETGAIVVFEE